MKHLELHGCPVLIGAHTLDAVGVEAARVAPAHTYAVITDDHLATHWLGPVEESLVRAAPAARVVSQRMRPGETNKTRRTWEQLTDWLFENGCGRDTTIVALGGGVVGDVAGFVAATFMRGVPVIQVPTSLVAMVDAALGGKTGVDTPAGKNLVGAFHQPSLVLIDPATLATLPAQQVRAGFAEILKHGAIADRTYFDRAARFAAAAHSAMANGGQVDWSGSDAEDLIARSVEIKADIVCRDERESCVRQVLNAGHTVAHAIELVSGFRLLHGEAVAIGLVAETRIAEAIGVASPGTAALLESALRGAGLPTRIPADLDLGELIRAMHADKKARRGRLVFAFVAEAGRMAGDEGSWTTMVGDDAVARALAGRVPNENAAGS